MTPDRIGENIEIQKEYPCVGTVFRYENSRDQFVVIKQASPTSSGSASLRVKVRGKYEIRIGGTENFDKKIVKTGKILSYDQLRKELYNFFYRSFNSSSMSWEAVNAYFTALEKS